MKEKEEEKRTNPKKRNEEEKQKPPEKAKCFMRRPSQLRSRATTCGLQFAFKWQRKNAQPYGYALLRCDFK